MDTILVRNMKRCKHILCPIYLQTVKVASAMCIWQTLKKNKIL